MKVYTVHEEQGSRAASDRVDRAERMAFVADGFSWPMAVVPPLVMLVNQMWIGLAVYIAALAAIVALLAAAGASPEWIALGVLALHVISGFEASELRRTALEARGWAMLGTVSGRSQAECERRFIEDWLPGQPLISGLRSQADAAPQGGDQPALARPPRRFGWPWSR